MAQGVCGDETVGGVDVKRKARRRRMRWGIEE